MINSGGTNFFDNISTSLKDQQGKFELEGNEGKREFQFTGMPTKEDILKRDHNIRVDRYKRTLNSQKEFNF